MAKRGFLKKTRAQEKDLPFVKYPDECQICHICETECPTKAIKVTIPLLFQ